MDLRLVDQIVMQILKETPGILEAVPLPDEDRGKILEIEKDAEERSLMGLGKVVNSGVRQVLECSRIFAALTSMDFDWGDDPSLILKKGDDLVGEEVRNPQKIEQLSQRSDTWFLHRNFVVYKGKIRFPQDIMQKICHFEIPCLQADWCHLNDKAPECEPMVYAFPCPPGDVFLKTNYFKCLDQQGQGTMLVGVRLKNVH